MGDAIGAVAVIGWRILLGIGQELVPVRFAGKGPGGAVVFSRDAGLAGNGFGLLGADRRLFQIEIGDDIVATGGIAGLVDVLLARRSAPDHHQGESRS